MTNSYKKVQAAYSDNQANMTSLQANQVRLEQQMMRLNIAQAFARQGVARSSHPWPQLAGNK
jgi:hypothetical protein